MKANKGQVIRPRNHHHQLHPQLSSAQVLRVVSSSPQLYHSVRIDQRQNRAIHVLPEKYQFCALGAGAQSQINSGQQQVPLGRCRANVHYGLCTDFDVFVVNEESSGLVLPPTPSSPASTSSNLSTISRFTYSVKMPAVHTLKNSSANSLTSTSPLMDGGSSRSSSSSSSSSIATRIERYRENIGAALELLDEYDEPAQLQNLIRNFVRQDRARQDGSGAVQQQTSIAVAGNASVDPSIAELDALEQKLLEVVQSAGSTDGLDSKGRKKITLKKPQQADLLARLQHQQQQLQNGLIKWGLTSNGTTAALANDHHSNDDYSNTHTANSHTPFLSTSRDGVVQSRRIRFGSPSRELSPVPCTSDNPLSASSSSSASLNMISSRTSNGFDLQPKRSPHHQPSSQHNVVHSGSLKDVISPSSSSSSTTSNSSEKTVFGISPKSSSLSRYKNLIEQRASSPVNFGLTEGSPSGLEPGSSNSNLSSPNPSTVPLTGTAKYNNSFPVGKKEKDYLPATSSVLERRRGNGSSSSATGIGSQGASGEPFLEITSHTLDPCQSPHAGSVAVPSWKTHQPSYSPDSAGIRVNDTAGKCIAVGGGGGGASSSPLSQSYLSSANSVPSTTSGARQAQQHSSSTSFAGSNLVRQHTQTGQLSTHYSTPLSPSSTPLSPTSLSLHSSTSPVSSSSSSPLTSSPYAPTLTNGNSSFQHPASSIDTFIKENEQLFGSGGKRLLLSRSLGLSEHEDDEDKELLHLNYIDGDNSVESESECGTMKIKDSTKLSSLTDDEKALLHETLKAGLYGDPKKKSRPMFISATDGTAAPHQNGQQNGHEQHKGADENSDPNGTSSSGKPSRRIILVSKPSPKPEPKPEPKYVNGKVVFGQLPVAQKQGAAVLQKGSVAERVLLFEKCPEKTSVTKGKLTELQRNRALNSPNKIGSWVRSGASEKEYVKIPKVAANNCTSSPSAQQTSPNTHKQITQRREAEECLKSPPGSISSVPTFRRFSRSGSISNGSQQVPGQLPRFHFPNGRPYSSHEVETQVRRIVAVFERFPSRSVSRKDLGGVLKLVGIPVYWKEPLFTAVLASAKSNASPTHLITANGLGTVSNGNRRSGSRSSSIDMTANGAPYPLNGASLKKEYISCEQFTDYWKRLISTCFDEAARFMAIATQGRRTHLIPEDLEGLIQDVVDTHPGLLFLKEAEEFHSRYVHTVIARIFYVLDRTWSGTVSLAELRKSNLLKVLQLLEEEEDINQITDYFSYEHFYVIYCKFWELDTDHDLYISKYDLSRHNDSAISSRMIDRIFSGAVTRGPRNDSDHQMSYAEFVWFLLSEEDKRHPRAIEYWFRCMDLDGDGALSMYELEYFYSEQVKRMEAAGIEALPFTDCLCQMIDLASPVDPLRITLNDLKRCRLTPVFFDTFFNLEKYLDHEQRDPFASQRDEDGLSMSDWDRYAAEEYELLVAEENAASSMSQSHANNRFYAYGGSNQLNQSSRHRYPSEECLNLDEYDEPYDDDEDGDDNEDETSSDSAMNDYECEEMQQDCAQESMASEEDDENDSDASGSDGCSANTDASTHSNVICKEEDCPPLATTLPRLKDSQLSVSSDDKDDIDDIGREFYEYINAEFACHDSSDVGSCNVSSASPVKKTVSSPPSAPFSSSVRERHHRHQSRNAPTNDDDKSNDHNNNPLALTTLDDEDFW